MSEGVFNNGVIRALQSDGTYGEVKMFKGSINTHDACVHDTPINEYFHRHTGVTTTLSVAALAGSIAITVASSASLSIGDSVQIEDGVIETTFPTITNIVGNVLTLDRPLDYSFDIGDTVEVIVFNMAVVGSLASPVAFRLIPDKNDSWHIVRFLIGMVHSGAADDSKLGDLPALTNGIVFRGYNAAANQHRTLTNWKTNLDIKMDMYDLDYTDKSGGGLYGTNGRGSIKIATGAAPKISGIHGDYLEILIQDDLSALTDLRLKGQGHLEST